MVVAEVEDTIMSVEESLSRATSRTTSRSISMSRSISLSGSTGSLNNSEEESKPLLSPDEPSRRSKRRKEIIGVFLAFVSGVMFTANNCVIQKFKLDFAEAMLFRGIFQITIFGIICGKKKLTLWPNIGHRPKFVQTLMICQGVLGGIMVIFSFACMTMMPVGDALTIVFAAPISTMIVAAIFLGHPLRLFKITLGLLLLIGTVLIVQPPFLFPDANEDNPDDPDNLIILFRSTIGKPHHDLYYVGVALAFGCALADGFLNISIHFCSEINSNVLMWWSGFGGFMLALLAFTFDGNARMLGPDIFEIPTANWLAYTSMSISGIFAYFCMTKSLQMIDPTVVSFVRALEIVVAYVAQYVVMEEVPEMLSLIGAALVLISVSSMTLQNFIVQLIPERIRFLF